MKLILGTFVSLVAMAVAHAASDPDALMAKLAADLSTGISQSGCKKVSVIDFTDLQGRHSDLGRFLAEDLSVQLVNSAKDFSVMDRANLKSVLDEHKLTASGLIDPKNAKDLGKFAGVDGIILGTITPLGNSLAITVKAISTETTQVLVAKKANLPKTPEFDAIMKAEPPVVASSPAQTEQPAIPVARPLKSAIEPAVFQYVTVEIPSIKINGGRVVVTVKVTNRSKVNPLRIGLNPHRNRVIGAFVTDDENDETLPLGNVSGLSFSRSIFGGNVDGYQGLRKRAANAQTSRHDAQRQDLASELDKATDIRVGQAIIFTLTFESRGRVQLGSVFTLNMELIVAEVFNGGMGANVELNNVVIPGLRP